MRHRVKVEDRIENQIADNRCRHYWVIEAANGPTSPGVCKYCGEKKIFSNSAQDFVLPKRRNQPLDLPEIPKVEIDANSQS